MDQLSPEAFAERHLRALGYEVLHTESVPFHALFAVLLWPLIEDSSDERLRETFFGERQAPDTPRRPALVRSLRPSDFGQPSYGHRRSVEIETYLSSLPSTTEGLVSVFDELMPGSYSLRQYLWAHRNQDAALARALIGVLGAASVHVVLRYLVDRYWQRYLGWPDIIAFRDNEYCLFEVKASRDKLTEDQKDWIRGNSSFLRQPFKIIKIHAAARV